MSKKEQAALTKERLFETAIRLFKSYGYDAVTISQICKGAGVAKGTFYVHYQAKEDIVKESYYSDLGEFVRKQYKIFIAHNPNAAAKKKMQAFLLSELMFAEHAGYEMTCRAFITNLTECIKNESLHFERREFTQILYELISAGIKENAFATKQTADELFLYIESFVRGLMASWCFSQGSFAIVPAGEKYINELLIRL